MLREVLQRDIDHPLGLRPRGQYGGRDAQHHLPEPAAAEDVADRLAAFASAEVVLQRRFLLGRKRPVRIADDVGPRRVGGGLDQHARVDHRAGNARGLQAALGLAPRLDERQAHSASAAFGASRTGAVTASPRPTRPGLVTRT